MPADHETGAVSNRNLAVSRSGFYRWTASEAARQLGAGVEDT